MDCWRGFVEIVGGWIRFFSGWMGRDISAFFWERDRQSTVSVSIYLARVLEREFDKLHMFYYLVLVLPGGSLKSSLTIAGSAARGQFACG